MEQNFSSFEKTIAAGTSQCDFLGSWKLSSLLEAMQDTANEHCRKLHMGRDDLFKEGFAWVIFKINLQIDRYPKIDEKVTVKTFTKGCQFKFFPRYYVVTDEDGNQVCRAGSLWMIMDTATRNTVSAKESGIELPNAKECEPPIKILTKSKNVEAKDQVSWYTPVYSDIDVNGHMNNVRYADILCNSFGLKQMEENEISFISIDYNYEVPVDTMLQVALKMHQNEFLLTGLVGDKRYFSIYGILQKRGS